MKTLKEYEVTERQLMEKLFSKIPSIVSYEFTSGRICYDAIIKTDKEQTILMETKVRNIEIDAYENYILEVQKLISLINKKKLNNYDKIYYCNFFKSKDSLLQEFIIFDLTPRIEMWKYDKPTIIYRRMNRATCQGDDKVLKEIIMLEYDPKIDYKGIMPMN